MSKDVLLIMVLYQPPSKKRSFENDYVKQTELCVDTLVDTGFPPEKILCISKEEQHGRNLHGRFGINYRIGPEMPPEFLELTKKNSDAYYFYKPIAIHSVVPESVNDDTIMSFCDVDFLFKKNPYSLLQGIEDDVWAFRGAILPHRMREKPPKRYHNPRNTYKDLKEFYYKQGGGAIAYLQLKYGFPLPECNMFTGWIAIHPKVYKSLIALWYEMCCEVISRDDLEKGDQEIFSAAAWALNLNCARASKVIKGWCNHYCGMGKKRKMKSEYGKVKGMIADRNARKARKEKRK